MEMLIKKLKVQSLVYAKCVHVYADTVRITNEYTRTSWR